ncbi:MAG: NADH-quinone oxidoreductase subunit C [Kiritimatiellae bacterium]|jgi:Ni,Fe-hydrogenase III component G|nr:NADH-quinone oxidoreductase subunit C [Kiritimatiellia bacterium]
MKREEIISLIREKLEGKIINWTEKSPRRIYVEARPEDIPEISRCLFRDLEARFSIATGTDTPSAMEVLYHWAFDQCGMFFSVRTKLNREKPEIESITAICRGAEWIEREMWELLGITFHNHPDMRHLLLSDDWPAGKYPLRRDYVR